MIEKGKQIYKETLNKTVYIEGIEILGDSKVISRGAHNYMANHNPDHQHSIGWHPNYDKLGEIDE